METEITVTCTEDKRRFEREMKLKNNENDRQKKRMRESMIRIARESGRVEEEKYMEIKDERGTENETKR